MIALVVNQRARRGADRKLEGRLRALLADEGSEADCELCVTADLSDLARAARRLCSRESLDLVISCGGDGTTMATLSAFLPHLQGPRTLPAFCLLPTGTVNTIARNVGVSGPNEGLLRAIVRGYKRGLCRLPFVYQDTLCVRETWEGGQTRYGCLFAVAMGARFLQTYYEGGEPSLGRAVSLMAKTLGSTLLPSGGVLARRLFAETPVSLTFVGEGGGSCETVEQSYRILLCSTIPDVGLGMKVAWQAGRSPGTFHLLATRVSIGQMAKNLPNLLTGNPMGIAMESVPKVDHLDRKERLVVLRFPTPQPYTLDGDLFHVEAGGAIEVGAGPTLRIVVPSRPC